MARHLAAYANLQGVTSVEVRDRSTVLFWKDLWHNNILCDSHPRLFSFATNEDVSVQELLTAPVLGHNFHLLISTQAREELRDLQCSMASTELSEAHDIWRCAWGTGDFAPRKYYDHCFRGVTADDAFKWIWKSKCTNKWRVFAWHLLADMLNTQKHVEEKRYEAAR